MSGNNFIKHSKSIQDRMSATVKLSVRLHEISDEFHVHRHIQTYIIQDLLDYEDVLEKEHDQFVDLVKTITLQNMTLHIGSVPLNYIDFFEFDGNEVREEYLKLIKYLDDYIDIGYKYGTFIDMDETINLVMTEKQYNTMKLCEYTTYKTLCDILDRYEGVVYSRVNAKGNSLKIFRFYNIFFNDYYFYRNETAFDVGFNTLKKLKNDSILIRI